MTGGKRRQLLLVEDDRDLSAAIVDALDEAGFDVIRAENGAVALDKLGDGVEPDVIVLDLMMPKMDGWQFRLAQKRDRKLLSIPVIVITANRTPQARAVDADIRLEKPFELDLLIGAVERALALRDRRAAEKKLAHADRFASVWTLASGIAHEINNPLTGLLGHLELAERLLGKVESEPVDRIVECVANAKQAAQQISRVVRDASTLASSEEIVVPVDPNAVLESALRMIATVLTRRADVESNHRPLPRVRASSAQLLQIFLNLLMNAVQALPDARRGTIRTRTFTSDAGQAVIEISDNGCGIARDQLTTIFDPFFTTKPPGQGSGLGLSICQELVSGLGGRITVKSEVDRGATFRVLLPPAASHKSDLRAQTVPAEAPTTPSEDEGPS